MNNKQDLESFFIRPPVPGELWKFDALEAHAFCDIFRALSLTELIRKENPILKSYLHSFDVVNDTYKLTKSDLDLPAGIHVTPTEEDRGFFTGIVPFFKIFVENEYAKIEKIKELQNKISVESRNCSCGNYDCNREYELPCGHSAKEHLTILEGWYKREIIETEKFTVSRSAVELVPYEERYKGKPIIARSDMERVVYEHVENRLNEGSYSEKGTEQMIQNFLYVNSNWSRQQAEEAAKNTRKALARQIREELIEKNEKEYRVIDI